MSALFQIGAEVFLAEMTDANVAQIADAASIGIAMLSQPGFAALAPLSWERQRDIRARHHADYLADMQALRDGRITDEDLS